MTSNITNVFEKNLDDRIDTLIKESYSKPDGAIERRRLLRLQEERHRNGSNKDQPYAVQLPEYFDGDDYEGVLDKTDPNDSKYIYAHEDYAQTINALKRWSPKRQGEIDGLRQKVKNYLVNEQYSNGTVSDDALASTDLEVPELFIKVRNFLSFGII